MIGKAHRLGLKARPSPVKANEPKPAPERKAAELRPEADELLRQVQRAVDESNLGEVLG